MNRKGKILVLIIVLLLGLAIYLVLPGAEVETPTVESPALSEPALSPDQKSILAKEQVLLSIENDAIFNWFKNESELCNSGNIGTVENRREFCESKLSFREQTKFSSIALSPDQEKIGFTIESETLAPDTVIGIFYPNKPVNQVRILTNYYLGNTFLGFSPTGINFAYQGNCFEGKCGIFIKDSETLAEKASLNNPEFADLRSENATWVRWLSDSEVEYILGRETKKASF